MGLPLLLKSQTIATNRIGRVPLASILLLIKSKGVTNLKGFSVAYYSDEARIFVLAPNPANTFIRMKEDIGSAGADAWGVGTLILKLSRNKTPPFSPSTCKDTPVMDPLAL